MPRIDFLKENLGRVDLGRGGSQLNIVLATARQTGVLTFCPILHSIVPTPSAHFLSVIPIPGAHFVKHFLAMWALKIEKGI